MFHSPPPYDSNQDSATTTVHIKRLIELLKEQKVLTSTLSKILENTDGCSEQYICAYTLYLIRYSAEAHLHCDFLSILQFTKKN